MPRILLLCLVIISLSAYGSSSTGLTIVPRAGGAAGAADDEPNNKRTTRTVAVGGSATGNIESSGDKDWFRVSLASATKYRFDLESEAVNGAAALGDPRLVFRNISADRLEFANGGGTGNNARLEYTVSSAGAGDYLLVAMGQRNTTGSYRLSVTALVNRAPQPAGSISGPPPLTERGSVWSVNVSGKFTDPDGDTLSYSAKSSDSAISTASAVGSTVTITPLAAGTATITVTAADSGGLTAAQEISVTVNSSNRAPAAKGSIDDLMVTLGNTPKGLDISEKFVDPDGDTLSYTAKSSDITIATVNASGNPVTITPVATGTVTITVTAKDPSGLKAAQTFSVTISNNAPTAISSISPITLTLGDEPETVDVSEKFSDPDGHTLTYAAESSDSTIATASESGNPVTITPVAAGAATITVTAKDLGGLSAMQEISVTVLPQPNRKPTLVGSIDDQLLEVGRAAGTVDVSGKFSDPDDDTLSYEVESSNTAIVVASILNSVVILTPVKGGTVTITVTAEDPDGLSAEQVFSASVSNRPPAAIGEIRDREELWVGDVINVRAGNKFIDPDGDTLTYEASISGANLATINISDNMVSFTIVAVGKATFRITAKDSNGGTATHEFSVTVLNRAPTANGSITNQRAWIGNTLQVDVSGKFGDPDRQTLTYSAISSHPTVATVRASDSTVIVTPVTIGTTTITVTAQDPPGETATQKFSVTVPNRAPETAGTINTQRLVMRTSETYHMSRSQACIQRHPLYHLERCEPELITATRTSFSVSVDVADKFTDPDGDTLTYTATISGGSFTSAQNVPVSGSTVSISRSSRFSGTVTVTARDPGGLTATQTFEVRPPNRAPIKVGSIGTQQLYSEFSAFTTSIDVSGKFKDPDGDTLTYSARSSVTNVATATASGKTVIIRAIDNGSTFITVTATDPEGLEAKQTFIVNVLTWGPMCGEHYC